MITEAASIPGSRVDPVTIEVIRNALPAISDEMSWDLERTSYNAMIYEVKDYTCAVIGRDGDLMSQWVGGCSHFVAGIGQVVMDGVGRFGLDGFQPGDVVIHNHQRVHGQHLNNVAVYTPCFVDGEIVAFPCVNAHWVDVGGMSTQSGGGGAVFDPWSEGFQFDQVKIYDAGVMDRKAMKFIRDNLRFPDAAMGDLRGQIAACRLAERRIQDLVGRYGIETFRRTLATIYDEAERKARAAVEKIPDGTYEAETFYNDPRGGEPYRLHAKVTVAGSDMTIDFSGCSPARPQGYCDRSNAGAYIPYKALTAPMDPVCEGSFRALELVIPEGNMMRAVWPMMMAHWSEFLPQMCDTVCLALAPAIPDRIAAGHNATLGGNGFSMFGWDPRAQRTFVLQSKQTSGGWGGMPHADGQDACIGMCQGDVRSTPIESDELKAPVLVLERSILKDSAGAGKFRGGMGTFFHGKSLAEARWPLGGSRRSGTQTWGLWGGKGGQLPDRWIKLPEETEFHYPAPGWKVLPAGTEVKGIAAGGGGWGDPLDREAWRVLEDVIEEYVSAEKAREEYGVVLTPDYQAVDEAATRELRERLRTVR